MRLIDADALFNWNGKKLSDAVKYGNKDSEQQSFSYSTLMMYEIADEIDDAPTIEPVKRGKWIEDIDEMECPECGSKWNYCDNDTERFDYCPKCGADMRAKAEI